jgi:hypothetical protein
MFNIQEFKKNIEITFQIFSRIKKDNYFCSLIKTN